MPKPRMWNNLFLSYCCLKVFYTTEFNTSVNISPQDWGSFNPFYQICASDIDTLSIIGLNNDINEKSENLHIRGFGLRGDDIKYKVFKLF